MAIKLTSNEISVKYNRFARWYDFVEGIPDLLGVRKLRRRLLPRASGKVLEVAWGRERTCAIIPKVVGSSPWMSAGDVKHCTETLHKIISSRFLLVGRRRGSSFFRQTL